MTLAEQYDVSLARLVDFNDLRGEEILVQDQLVYLQRKRKTGAVSFHVVQPGESLYNISQAEGIRLESVQNMNQLSGSEEPAIGEKIYLQSAAPAKPALAGKKQQPAQIPDTTTEKEKTTYSTPITHVVKNRETLYSISKKYSVDVAKIQQWNKLDDMDLKKGQELIIYKY